MSEPFLGEIKIGGWNFAPRGWALCNGQLLPINQNQALFSILGTTYGGNGTTTFALPDLRGRIPVHRGNAFSQGEKGGETAHTVTIQEMPMHSHAPVGSSNAPSSTSPAGKVWARQTANAYGTTPETAMNSASILNNGGGQAHANLSPYLVLNFVIALQGIFPSQN